MMMIDRHWIYQSSSDLQRQVSNSRLLAPSSDCGCDGLPKAEEQLVQVRSAAGAVRWSQDAVVVVFLGLLQLVLDHKLQIG